MNFKKTSAVIIAAAMIASLSACGNDKAPENTGNATETTTTATETTTAATTTTTAQTTTTEATETDAPADGNISSDAESIPVYYGWGQDEDEYTAYIYCPEGAQFDEYTLEAHAEHGTVMSAEVIDEVNEYSAISNSYWHPDAYSSDDPILSIMQQLYFNGEIDADTAEEYSGCSQKVTPLGFKWNGYDVVMIETTYTFMDYGEQTDIFTGVEYDLKYWKANAGTGGITNLVTKGLFGFDVLYYGWEEMTQEQYAWITGELFGVDSGIENPFANNSEEADTAPVDIDPSALLGTWTDKTSDWEDTYFFDYNGNGSYTSGFENTFTWSVEGNVLTVFYAEDDIESFAATVNENELVLIDKFGYEQSFEKVTEETESETDTETDTGTEEDVNPNITAIIGTWTESTTGIDETFTFNDDGTGFYSCLSEDGIYECGFTYEFFRSDYIDIYFDDGDVGGFLLSIDGNEMTVRNDFVWDLVYTRQ